MMNGTPFWPNRDFFEEKVLFLETSEDKPTPKEVGYFLRNLGVQGILERINGLLIARPKSYTYEEKKELDNEVKKIVRKEFDQKELNIITNIDFGHTEPRHIIPFGVKLELESDSKKMSFVESLFV